MSGAIALHVDQAEVHVGDELTGAIEVLQDLPTARGVAVLLVGGGTHVPTSQTPAERVAEGPLRAGQRLPFTLDVPPDTAPTYQGQQVSLAWRVRATVDVPWAFDPTVEQPVVVSPMELPGAQAREAFLARRAAGQAAQQKAHGLLGKVLGCALLLLFAWPLLFLLLLLAPVLLVVWARDGLVRTRLREFRAEVPAAALLGEPLPVEVSFELRRPIDVDEVTVTLTCQEHWVTSSGKNTQHHTRTVFEQKEALVGPGVIAPAHRLERARFQARTAFQLPAAGPPSIGQSPRPQVTWTVTARAWLVGWPDPKEEKRVDVVPATSPTPPPLPPAAPAEATSAGLVFVPRGAPAPLGVDVTTAGAAVWPWLVMPFVGVALAAADVLMGEVGGAGLSPLLGLPPHAVTWAGAGLVALGAGGTAWRMSS